MKKKSLSLLTLVCALCLALFACRKEIGQLVNADTPNVSASKLEAAKIFNAKFIAQHISENAKIPGFVTLAPQWDQAWTVSATGGTEYIAVPTILDHVDQLNVTLSRLFLFEMKADQVVNAQIVEFVGLNYNVDRNQNDLILKHKSASIAGFNGAIIHYDLNYRRTDGSIYEGGEIKLTNAAITRKETFNEPASDKKIPLYLSTLSTDGSGNYLISNYKYLFTPSGRLRIASGESGNGSGNASGMGGELSEVVITAPGGGGTSGGGGGTTPGGNPPPTGGSGGSSNTLGQQMDNYFASHYFIMGGKPLAEHSSICGGVADINNRSKDYNGNHNKEVTAFVTEDNKVIVTDILGSNGGKSGGLYVFDKQDGSAKTYWYRYNKNDGAPSQTYATGTLVTSPSYYYIKVKAMIHSHPCNFYGSDGVTDINLSSDDKTTATNFPGIRHYLVGCDVIGSYNKDSTKPIVEGNGPLSDICGVIQ